jgi:integrase/recombinase XerD
MPTRELVDRFIQSRYAKGLSRQAIRWYGGILNLFDRQYPVLPLNPDNIEEFLAKIPGDERRHGYYRALRAMYKFGNKRLGLMDPFESIDSPRRTRKYPRVLMPDELDQLLSYPHTAKVKAALLFLIDTGCRVGECCYLQPSDFSETPWGYVVKVNGKTGERYVPVSYETYQAMMKVLPFGFQKHWLSELISRAFKEANVKGTAHTLRHTFCTLWEGDPFALQRIVGHARISTTLLYRHLKTAQLSRQHNEFSPLRMVLTRSRSML